MADNEQDLLILAALKQELQDALTKTNSRRGAEKMQQKSKSLRLSVSAGKMNYDR